MSVQYGIDTHRIVSSGMMKQLNNHHLSHEPQALILLHCT